MEEFFKQQEKAARKAEKEQQEVARKAREADRKNEAKVAKKAEKELEKGASAAEKARAAEIKARESAAKKAASSSSSRKASLSGRRAGDPSARSEKPSSASDVIEWFKACEYPRSMGREPGTGAWHPWFFGIISRGDAEQLLSGKPVGAFLVRVSSRIWGYTLSFVDRDRFKHFLVDSQADGRYSVYGSQSSRTHVDLVTLVKFHQTVAVSKTGVMLTVPVNFQGHQSLHALTPL